MPAPDVILSAALGIIVAVVAYATFRQAQRATKAQSDATKTVVDAAAYDRAKELYESAIKTVTDESDRLRLEVSRLHTEVVRMNTVNNTLQGEVGKLQTANSTLQTEVTKLRREVAELRRAS
jgi:peptidoglycan hydrolase CwlO-like protein